MEFPIGFKFYPTDEQLLLLLKHKTRGDSDHDIVISTHASPFLDPTTIDWSPISFLDDNERFVFVKRQKMSKNSRRIKRSWESGTWRAATAPTQISDHHSQVYGHKIQLDFLSGPSKSPTQYLMHEFSLPNEDEWVVCRIKKGAKKSSTKEESAKRRRREEDDELSKFAAHLESVIEDAPPPPPHEEVDLSRIVKGLEDLPIPEEVADATMTEDFDKYLIEVIDFDN